MSYDPLKKPYHIILVLGDQLDFDASAFDGFNPASDAVWMAEVAGESTHVWSHKARIAVFLSSMRYFRDALRQKGITIHYSQLEDPENRGNFTRELKSASSRLKPERFILTKPGEWRVQEDLVNVPRTIDTLTEIPAGQHFFT